MDHVAIGPTGGLGGHEFVDYSIPTGGRLKAIHVFASEYIDAIQFECIDSTGNQVMLPKIGGWGGTEEVFVLDDDEYLVAISGMCDWYIDTIQFHTNKRASQTFGGTHAHNEFRLEVPVGYEVAGLFGRFDWFIDALGVIGRTHTPAQTPEPAGKPATKKAAPAAKKAAPAPTPAADGERTPKPKDLEKIEGIGPKIAGLLVENGIVDLAALAQADVEQLRTILKGAGSRYATADPTTWPEQAALGARGDWSGLTELQKKLDKGRRS